VEKYGRFEVKVEKGKDPIMYKEDQYLVLKA